MISPAQTPLFSILCFVVASLFGAVGQFLYKSGADKATNTISSYLLNWRILAGIVSYIAVMVLFVAAFKRGGALTVLYPIYATTFIWAAVIAFFRHGSPIEPVHMLGMALLMVGIVCMSW